METLFVSFSLLAIVGSIYSIYAWAKYQRSKAIERRIAERLFKIQEAREIALKEEAEHEKARLYAKVA